MAKRKQGGKRPFRREALDAHADPALRVRRGPGEAVWRFTLTIPLEEVAPHQRQVATADDLETLQQMLADHLGGFTRLPNSPGFGLRDPKGPDRSPEMNYNTYFVVLTSPVP